MDTLEIVLREQMDVVDKFFLGRISFYLFVVSCSLSVEANFTHKGVNTYKQACVAYKLHLKISLKMRKPMMWSMLKNTKRFRFVPRYKVQHIAIGMA